MKAVVQRTNEAGGGKKPPHLFRKAASCSSSLPTTLDRFRSCRQTPETFHAERRMEPKTHGYFCFDAPDSRCFYFAKPRRMPDNAFHMGLHHLQRFFFFFKIKKAQIGCRLRLPAHLTLIRSLRLEGSEFSVVTQAQLWQQLAGGALKHQPGHWFHWFHWFHLSIADGDRMTR